jgi:phenylpropionate dioxygenase-like ring-hydroxylating dioxygenase large terminal subunit
MDKYRKQPDAVQALVREDQVHRDVYLSPEVFALEMAHLWRNTWIYVGHDSQVPKSGDFYTTTVATQSVILLRGDDEVVRVLMNRCAHKGTQLVSAPSGQCAGHLLRCPYHGWTYRLDGSVRSIPQQSGYDGSAFADSTAARGIVVLKNMQNYRGFVFVRLAEAGPSFAEYFGDSLSSIDNLVDRSPAGRLEVAGGTLRYLHDCNWKMFIENLNDTMHPMVAHQAAAGTAKKLWAGQPETAPKPMAVEQFLPFVNGYAFFDAMGVKLWENGHSYSGVNFSIHSQYAPEGEYETLMEQAYGAERARAILGEVRHNTVYYPSLTIKGAIQAIRIARPIAHDKTLIESVTFRLVGAPAHLLERTVLYTRLINAPTSMVGHDDRHCYRAIQQGLATDGNEWVSLHRNHDPAERAGMAGVYNGLSEVSMRGQYRAWARFIQPAKPTEEAA